MKKDRLTGILLILGIALVVVSLAVLLISFVSQNLSAGNARNLVVQLRQLMPNIQNATPDDRINVMMPSMEIQGDNFCGILEIPAYNADLPVRSAWDSRRLSDYPCRFTGSIYDGSLIIGGTDNSGQFDFMKNITGGDLVYVMDMTGGRYRCIVTDVYRTKDVSSNHLMSLDADLVLFAKNSFSFDYTLVLCKIG